MKETTLYGCKIGEPSEMEEVLYSCKGYVDQEAVMNKGKEWAEKYGYDRLRLFITENR